MLQESSSINWPAGWTRQRLVHASSDDLLTLADDERQRLFDSLRSALGQADFQALLDEMSRNYKERLKQQGVDTRPLSEQLKDMSPEFQAPILDTLNRWYKGEEWGFVAFRTSCYGQDDTWARFKERWEMAIEESFRPVGHVPGIKQAEALFRIHWVEDAELEDAGVVQVAASVVGSKHGSSMTVIDMVRRHYRAILDKGDIPGGLAQPLCLSIDSASVQSTLDSLIPTPSPISTQSSIPFALAVARYAGEDVELDAEAFEEHGFRTSFKVAVRSLADELFFLIGGDILSLGELSLGMEEDKVWWTTGRMGTFKITSDS